MVLKSERDVKREKTEEEKNGTSSKVHEAPTVCEELGTDVNRTRLCGCHGPWGALGPCPGPAWSSVVLLCPSFRALL